MEGRAIEAKGLESVIEQAKASVRKVGPREYELIGVDDDDFCIDFYGCEGEEGQTQKDTAKLMDERAAIKKPIFAVGLGDRFYDEGVQSPLEERFETQHYNVYCNPALTHIAQVPHFHAIGNHDGNRYYVGQIKARSNYALTFIPFIGAPIAHKYIPNHPVGEETELNQLAHTYIPRKGDPIIPDSYEHFYQRKQLPLFMLRKFNLPYFYYSVTVNNIIFFFLNSNTYAQHYFNWMTGRNTDPLLNQRNWFKSAYERAKLAGKTIIVIQHHPLIVCDKRAFSGDAYLYLDRPTPPHQIDAWQQLAETFHLDPTKYLYSELLLKMFEKDEIQPDLIVAAHSHMLRYDNNRLKAEATYKICQVTSGAAGGKLMVQKDFSHDDIKGCQESKNGFFKVTFHKANPKIFDIECFTTDGLHYQFTNESHHQIEPASEKKMGMS